MAEEDQGSIVSRLEVVERTTQQLRLRLDTIEQSIAGSTKPSALAPEPQAQPQPQASVWIPSGPPPVRRRAPAWMVPNQTSQPKPKSAPVKDEKRLDDLEYKIGLTGLLRGGAVVIVIGIIYMVGLVASRGLITPRVQFAGELGLCLAFMVFGFIKRNEREDFGQLMVGIGSCGMYLSFAGAHLNKHLFSGEVLVTLFVSLSFANLGFATWRSSKSFLAIGMIGGLTAAMLPMHQYKPILDIGLHFLILVPTALIVLKNRWRDMAVALWITSTAALIPVLTYDSVWMVRIGGLYGASLICAAIYAFVWTETEFDPWCGISALIVATAGIGALAFDEVRHGSLHVLVLAAAGIIAGLGFNSKPIARNAFWLGSLATAVALSPIGYHRFEAGMAFALMSIGLALASLRFNSKALTALGVTELALGLCAYIAPWTNSPIHFGLGAETWLLTAFMVATVASAYASAKTGRGSQAMLLAACVLLLPLFTRAAFILLTAPAVGFLPSLAVLIPFMIFAAGLLVIGRRLDWTLTLVLGCCTLVLANLQYWQLISDGFRSPGFDSLIVLILMGGTVYGALGMREEAGRDFFDTLVGIAGVPVAIFVVRLAFIWLTIPPIHLGYPAALTVGALVAALFSGSLAIRMNWRGLVPQGWVMLLLASVGALGLQETGHYGLWFEILLLAACISGVLLMVKGAHLFPKQGMGLAGFGVATIWVLFSKLAFIVFTSKWLGIKETPALTLAWTVFAIALILAGFAYHARYLRFWSFGVFGSTIVKIFLFDLAALDAGIRVFILMLLGIGMVGAGYWYVRREPVLGAKR